MSLLQMFACEGCSATADPRPDLSTPTAPRDWLAIEGPVTTREDAYVRESLLNKPAKHHVCSPACLATLAERLAALPDALRPLNEVKREVLDEL